MAMKWVAQIPHPVEIDAIASHSGRIALGALREWFSRLVAAKDASAHTSAASTTRRRSCAVAIQV